MNRMRMLLACLLAAAAAAMAGDTIVGFRTDTTGLYPHATPTIEWGPEKNVLWATDMPSWGNAMPVLVDGKIFVCAEPNSLLCVNAADGKILWTRPSTYEDVKAADPSAQVPGRLPKTERANGYSSPTPTTDGKHVYALFGTGVLACFDLEGNRKWVRFTDVPPHKNYGASASPMRVAGKLLVHIRALTAYDPATGKQLWSQPKAKWSWGTPIPCGGGKAVVTAGGDVVRVSDGEILATKVGHSNYGSPMVLGDVVYQADFGSNSGTTAHKLTFTADGGVTVERLWQIGRHKSRRYYASPVLHEGLLYIINERNLFTVIDTATGQDVHEQNLAELGRGRVYSSISIAGGYAFASHERGTTLVFKTGRTPRKVATNKLDMFRSTPVFSGGRMYLRTYKKLYCIGT